MSSSKNFQQSPAPSPQNPTEKASRNEKAIICQHCTSVVILPNVGVWSETTFDLPLARQQKGVDTQKEPVSGFWAIQDKFSFENVGFTNASDGVKYLICADCEYGPIGFVDNDSTLNLITPSRLKYKD